MRHLPAAFAAAVLLAAPALAQPVVRSGFDTRPGERVRQLAAGQTIDGWTVTGPGRRSVTLVSGDLFEPAVMFNAGEGAGALDLTGSGNQGARAGIFRDVATVAGFTYDLFFLLGNATGSVGGADGNSFAYRGASSVALSIGGVGAGVFTNAAVSPNAVDWRGFSHRFVAAGATTRIAFNNATPASDNYLGLDAVAVAAVPEPAAWALMIGGVGAVGGALRRRRAPRAALA